tara:strand:- start:156 stop:374 length:219 start_codon:yes stop_codon:yes gene_type:complete
MKNYKVTYALDSLDPNPTIKIFNCSYEAEDWIDQQVENAVSWQVEHSPYSISEDELEDLRQIEFSNIRYEEV